MWPVADLRVGMEFLRKRLRERLLVFRSLCCPSFLSYGSFFNEGRGVNVKQVRRTLTVWKVFEVNMRFPPQGVCTSGCIEPITSRADTRCSLVILWADRMS